MAQYDLSVIFRVLDRATGPLTSIGRKFRQLALPIDEVTGKMNTMGKATRDFGNRMGQIGKSIAFRTTLPLSILGGIVTKTAISFESAWTGVRKTVEGTDEELSSLKRELLDLARVTPLPTETIFGIAEAAGQLGIQIEAIPGFTKVMAALAATTNIAAIEGASLLAQFANFTKMTKTPEMFSRLGSVVSYLGNKLATTEMPIVEMAHRLGAAGKRANMTEAQIVSLAGILASLGLEAEAGGTAFSMAIRTIVKELGTGSQKIKGFSYIAGEKTVKDFEKAWKKDAAGVMVSFVEGLAKLEAEGKNTEQIFEMLGLGGIRISDTLSRAALSGNYFRQVLEWGTESWEENNATVKEANLRYATTASRLQMLRNRVRELAADWGELLLPIITKYSNALKPVIEYLQKLDPVTKKIIMATAAFVAIIAPLIVLLGAFIWAIGIIMASPLLGWLAAVGAAIAGITAGVLTIVKNWDFLKEAFKENPFAFIVDLLSVLTAGIIPAFEKWVQLWKEIRDIIKAIPDFLKERFSGTPPPGVSKFNTEEFLRSFYGKSETDINIRVSAEPGFSASIEGIEKKKGNAVINTFTEGYVGVYP